jgi:AraC-like DNA-binding protein
LNPPPPAGSFHLSRRKPAPALAPFIDHYWSVTWNLRNHDVHTQEVFPHPNVHVVFERGTSTVFGVVTRKFSRQLVGASAVFGIQFAAGMFRTFLGRAVSQLRNRTVPACEVFGGQISTLEQASSESPENILISYADAFFQSRIPERDDGAILANGLVRQVLNDANLLTVEDLCRCSGLGKRNLQRLFAEYVGVNPKWVIRCARLHEALERLRAGERVDGARLAYDLGYCDQSHLINDFKAILGYTPLQFQRLRLPS